MRDRIGHRPSRSFRAAIEVRALQQGRPRNTGIGNYVAGVVGALGDVDATSRYSLVTSKLRSRPGDIRIVNNASNVRVRPLGLPRRVFAWLQRRDRLPPFDLMVPRQDVFLFTNFLTYPLRRVPFSVIVYDLSFVHAADSINDGYRAKLAEGVPRAVRRAGSVITPSETVRTELMDHFSLPPGRIVAAPPGVDRRVFQPIGMRERRAVRDRLALPDRYFLIVGTLEPRKNLLRLLAAYTALPREMRAREALVIAGMKGWKDNELWSELARLRASGERIHVPGYVDAGDLPALYSGATAFVYPSIYEGFGMPILEAMACGTPVITSDRASMPEAADGAAVLVDPTDVGRLSSVMAELASDPGERQRLVDRGLARAARADWRLTAKRVVFALELAAETGSSGVAPQLEVE